MSKRTPKRMPEQTPEQSTPNANSLGAHRGSERVVGDGEDLSTLKTRGEIYPTYNQELEGV